MSNNKEKPITFRGDEIIKNRIEEIKRARGIESTSEVIRMCILNTKILNIGDAGSLCAEIYKIREMLEKNEFSFELEGKVDRLCQFISELLQSVES